MFDHACIFQYYETEFERVDDPPMRVGQITLLIRLFRDGLPSTLEKLLFGYLLNVFQ